MLRWISDTWAWPWERSHAAWSNTPRSKAPTHPFRMRRRPATASASARPPPAAHPARSNCRPVAVRRVSTTVEVICLSVGRGSPHFRVGAQESPESADLDSVRRLARPLLYGGTAAAVLGFGWWHGSQVGHYSFVSS